jgi:hypothetical protein
MSQKRVFGRQKRKKRNWFQVATLNQGWLAGWLHKN